MPRPAIDSADGYTPSSANERRGMADLFAPAPGPKTVLGVYRILAPRAGVRVSPLCLGGMSLGDQWTGFMGTGMNAEKSEEFLDAYYEAGGNFIDVACNYQDEQTELIVGEWMEKRGIRDEIVLATKYTTYGLDRKEGRFKGIAANYVGNARKNLMLTVEDSLKKLKTNYIDLLYVHWWDYSTSVEEVMESLNILVKMGKVLYLGVSDTPAWIVAQANQYARDHGLSPFTVYQGSWSVANRDMERDIIPMCRANGMAIAPYGVLGQGKFKSPEELKERADTLRGGMAPTEKQIQMGKVLQEVAEGIGGNVKLANIGLAWTRQMVGYCYPILGGTSIENLKSNIDALKIQLTDQQMEKLSNALPMDWGFPYAGFGRDPHFLPDGKPNNLLLNAAAPLKFVNHP